MILTLDILDYRICPAAAQISPTLLLADGGMVALFDVDGWDGASQAVAVGRVGVETELLAPLLPDGAAVNGYSLSLSMDATALDFVYATQPGPWEPVTIHSLHSDDGGLTWGEEVQSDYPVSVPGDMGDVGSLPADPISPPSVETVGPVPEVLPMPREVVEHPDDLPLTWDDAGLALVAMQRMGGMA